MFIATLLTLEQRSTTDGSLTTTHFTIGCAPEISQSTSVSITPQTISLASGEREFPKSLLVASQLEKERTKNYSYTKNGRGKTR